MKKLPIKWFAVFSLSLLVVSCTGCSTIRKAYWDHKVKELCLKDAGVTVYEKVGMRKEEYDKFRLLDFDKNDPSQKYYTVSNDTYLKKDKGLDGMWVKKYEEVAIRKSDTKVLGNRVSFGRRGGDSIIFSWMHPSSFGCHSMGIRQDLQQSIFYSEE